jgi:hypothetical protein
MSAIANSGNAILNLTLEFSPNLVQLSFGVSEIVAVNEFYGFDQLRFTQLVKRCKEFLLDELNS